MVMQVRSVRTTDSLGSALLRFLTPDDFRLDQLCCKMSYFVHVYVYTYIFFRVADKDFKVADKEHEPAPTFCKLENSFKR